MAQTPAGGTPPRPPSLGARPNAPSRAPAPPAPKAGGPPGRPSMPPRPVTGPTPSRIFSGTGQKFALTNSGNQEPYAPGRDSIPKGQVPWYVAPIGALGPLEDEPRPPSAHPYASAVGQAHQVASQMQEAYHTEVIAQASKKRRS